MSATSLLVYNTQLGTRNKESKSTMSSDDLDPTVICATEFEIALDCVLGDPGGCGGGGCIDTSVFDERFSLDIENEFRQQIAAGPTSEDGFCEKADERLCNYHANTLSCCCEEETLAFVQCSFNTVYMDKFEVAVPCELSCGGQRGGGDGPSIVLLGSVVGAVAFLCLAFIYYKRRRNSAHQATDNNQKDGSGTETGSDKTVPVDVETAAMMSSMHNHQQFMSNNHAIQGGFQQQGTSDPYNRFNEQFPPHQQQQLIQQSGLSHSMRIDATGALIPNRMMGDNNDPTSMSMRSMRMHQIDNSDPMSMSMRSMRMHQPFQPNPSLGSYMNGVNGGMIASHHMAAGGSCGMSVISDDSFAIRTKKSSKSNKSKRSRKSKKSSSSKRRYNSDSSSSSDSDSSSDSNSSTDEESNRGNKKSKKKKKNKTMKDEMKVREEYEKELLRKEREAKMLRFEQKMSSRKLEKIQHDQEETEIKLQEATEQANILEHSAQQTIEEIEAEKEDVVEALEELEDENEDMMIRIAELEEENAIIRKAKKKKKRSKSAERKLMTCRDEQQDEDDMRPPLRRARSAEGALLLSGSSHHKRRSKSKERKLFDDDYNDFCRSHRSRSKERKFFDDGKLDKSHRSISKERVLLDNDVYEDLGKSRRSRSKEHKLLGYEKDHLGRSSGSKSKEKKLKIEDDFSYDDDDDSFYEDSNHKKRKKKKKRSKSIERGHATSERGLGLSNSSHHRRSRPRDSHDAEENEAPTRGINRSHSFGRRPQPRSSSRGRSKRSSIKERLY